jgi:hypothetical protein
MSWVDVAREIAKWATRESIRYNKLYNEGKSESEIAQDPEYRYAKQQRIKWERKARK